MGLYHQERRKQGKPVIKSEDYIIIWEIKGHILFLFLSVRCKSWVNDLASFALYLW